MYETLFKYPAVLGRYREGPYAEARERFVEDCARQGYAPRTLVKIAWVLMAAAFDLDLDKGKISAQDVEHAVDRRRHFARRPEGAKDAQSSRQLFIHFATAWLRSMDRLEQPADERPFREQIGAFTRYMRDERGLSPVTIKSRCERLAWFFDGLQPPRDCLREVTIAGIDAFIEKKHDEGWTRSSLSVLAGSLRSFFHYAESQGWCAPGLAAAIDLPRLYMREGLPEGPAWEDVQRLLDGARGDRPVDIRDHAILLLLALYGLRRGEVAALRLDDLDWERETICVTRPKTRGSQRYPFLPVVGNAILRYLREVRPCCQHRELFLALTGPFRPLTARSISAVAHARLTALDIKSPRRGAHCLRHACAGHLLAEGFTLKQIGDHLGHRNANSTMDYTKVDLNGLRQVAELDLGALS